MNQAVIGLSIVLGIVLILVLLFVRGGWRQVLSLLSSYKEKMGPVVLGFYESQGYPELVLAAAQEFVDTASTEGEAYGKWRQALGRIDEVAGWLPAVESEVEKANLAAMKQFQWAMLSISDRLSNYQMTTRPYVYSLSGSDMRMRLEGVVVATRTALLEEVDHSGAAYFEVTTPDGRKLMGPVDKLEEVVSS